MIDKSFFLVRTNPTLTGNVKLVVNTKYQFFLESFQTNKTLAQQKFKHVEIKKDEYWKEVLPFFFKDVESQSIFEIKYDSDSSELYNEYQEQYDDTYFSGALAVEDNYYNEEYEYFAPLYLKASKLPKKFIILRIDGPGSLTQNSDSSNFRKQIIDQWKFVKMYDLTENSDLGVWLKKNFIQDDDFPKHPLWINHNDDLTQVSGVDIKTGGWTTKSINLKESQSNNTPIFKTEEQITRLWETNDLIYPHILNLKFLFDDTPATSESLREYTINRYLGFYVDDMPITKTVSPYEPFELNKVDDSTLNNLNINEISEIPYLQDNKFVRSVNGRLYSFDPIKKGWDDTITYWIEWQGKYYRLERIENPDKLLFNPDGIIGDYIYRVISEQLIECEIKYNKNDLNVGFVEVQRYVHDQLVDSFVLNENALSESILNIFKKVLINELSTGKNKIKITPNLQINNKNAYNVIQNLNPTFTQYTRIYELDTNANMLGFRLDLNSSSNNNLFDIPHFNDADLFLMEIGDKYQIIKRYDSTTPNFGGMYYLQSDSAFDINEKHISHWINNGNISKNPLYYYNQSIENINIDNIPPMFNIVRINFTDIKDFDFDRVETEYARYEYSKKYSPSTSLEPKLYAKEYRNVSVKVRSLSGDKARRIPILDLNNRPYNVRDQIGEMNIFTGLPYTADELYRKEYDDTWSLFSGNIDGTNWYSYTDREVSLRRKFYREENYIWRIEEDNQIYEVDYMKTSIPKSIENSLTWGLDGKGEISDNKLPLTLIESKNDPNKTVDINYIPVSSEYINSDELWEVKNNDLTEIWRKNQSICKWGFLNSQGIHDYPYRLNYSLDLGHFNREPNIYSGLAYPLRANLDLDYFYRFGISNNTDYDFYSLHLKESYFDVNKYYSTDYNYFEYLFKSDQETSNGIQLTTKFSSFVSMNEYNDPFTLFRGIKYSIQDVSEIKFNEDDSSIIEDIITNANTKYEDYDFSIIFGRKLNSTGNNNSGVDIYVNDYWKNILIHLYIDTEDTLQITGNDGTIYNAETCEIDIWYRDNQEKEEIDVDYWEETGFKVNNSVVARPRDFKLSNFLNLLSSYNYIPPTGKDEVNFIHIYEDGTISDIMNYSNTDIIITYELPSEITIKEKSFEIKPINVNTFDINNTLKNRIILDDDSNSNQNNVDFTSDGFRVNSIPDINAYNEYPISRTIQESNKDTRAYWALDSEVDPQITRYSGPYVPIFYSIPLFRPMGYLDLNNQITSEGVGVPNIKESGRWKFYDPSSSLSNPNLINFGSIREIIFSKVNPLTNILKLSGQNKSLYPMVDEYGYEFDSRYLFTSNWESGFFTLSRQVHVDANEYPDVAGYTISYDGINDFLRIPDAPKFNLERYNINDMNYENYILQGVEGERSFLRQTVLGVDSNSKTVDIKLLANQRYKITFDSFNNVGATRLDFTAQIINDPNNSKQSGTKYIAGYSFTSNLSPNGSTNTAYFYTNQYISLISRDISNNIVSFGNTITGTPLESYNVYNSSINVRLTYTTNNGKLDLYPFKLELDGIVDNFLEINVGGTDGTGGIVFENNTIGIWGGYLRMNESQIGDVHQFPFRITGSNNYKTYPLLVSNLNTALNSPINRGLIVEAGQSSSGNLTNITNPYIRISSTDPFTFEPERWTNIMDGNSIVYIGQKTGDSSVNPEYVLRWFNTFKKPRVIIHTTPIHKFEPLISRKKSGLFKTIAERAKKAFIPGVVSNDNRLFTKPELFTPKNSNLQDLIEEQERIERELKRNPFYKKPSLVNELANIQAKIATQNALNQSIAKPKFISPLGKFNLIPHKSFLPVPLPKPEHLTGSSFEKVFAKQSIADMIVFDIIPDNGDRISVSIPSTNSDNSSLSMTQIINLINNVITPNYQAVEVPTTDYFPSTVNQTHFKTFKIVSQNSGSYYNFKLEIKAPNLSVINNTTATIESTISEKFNKTSLKDANVRQTGFIKDYTVEFWVKIDGWSKSYETILYKGLDTTLDPWTDTSFTDFTFIIGKDSSTNSLAFRTCHTKLDGTKTQHTLLSQSDISDGGWYHVACVVDLDKKRKSIYINGRLDSKIDNYLTSSYNYDTLSEQEIVALFLDNRARFLPNSEDSNLFPEFTSLASKIKNNVLDNKTHYWYDAIRGYRQLEYWDINFQHKNLGITIDEAFENFQTNLYNLDYYLTGNKTNNWSVLIATDSTLSLGRRNFKGAIDELRFWNYARTVSQIQSNYQSILRPESYLDPLQSLVAYYRFDEGKGVSVLKDLMDGKMISDLNRWARLRTSFTNDGNKEREKEEVFYFQFESAYHAGSNITVLDTDELDWIISKADIKGYSDERYTTNPPPSTEKVTDTLNEKPLLPKSDYKLTNTKPVIDVKSLVATTNASASSKVNWLTQLKNKANSIVDTMNFIKTPITQPTKIVEVLTKSPSSWVNKVSGLFKKRKK